MPKTAWKAIQTAIKGEKVKIVIMWTLIFLGNALSFSIPYFLKLIADYALEHPGDAFVVHEILFPLIGVVSFFVLEEVCYRVAHYMEIFIDIRIY